MKRLLPFVLAACLLLAPAVAHAYAIYSFVDHKVCIQTFWSQVYENCKFMIPAKGTHNGGHGESLSHVTAVYLVDNGTKCRCNEDGFSIPKGGYARIYPNVVKVYKHDGTHVEDKQIYYCQCECGKSGK